MSSKILRAVILIILLTSLLPQGQSVRAAPPLPPVDMFQLPWELGKAWVAYDGFGRHATSAHNPANGGAVDFAPHPNMKKGENTSSAWVTAAADGRVVAISKCHLIIAHSSGWVSEYQHLANFQVKLGDAVTRNQRLAVIANASAQQPVCLGSVETDTPHLHFSLRPNMVGATFAGWEFRYNSLFKTTTFKKEGNSEGLFKPLLNVMGSSTTPTPIPTTPTSATPATPTLIPTATSTAPSGPYISTTVNTPHVAVGDTALVTVSLNNVPAAGYTSAEITCAYNANLIEASSIVFANLFGADPATSIFGPQGGSFIAAIAGAKGNKATTSGTVLTFTVKGLQAGLTAIDCTARISQGNNVLTSIPYVGTSITVLGSSTSTPPLTSTPVPASPTPTQTPTSAIPTDWLTFINLRYGFEFKYPPQGQVQSGNTNTFARIDLPIVPGTTLYEKYLEIVVQENASLCQSPLPTNQPSETVTINGISFLKQTGLEGAAGSIYQWVAYSTFRDDNNACISLDFILHYHDPGFFATPPPVFDYDAESAVFGQVVSTYFNFLELIPTSTPTIISTPLGPSDLVPSLSFVPVVTGLSQPVLVTNAGDGSGRLFVLERAGRVRVISSAGSLLPASFLDITSIVGSSGSEEGLLGLAFHPNYESNGLFFVAYTNASGNLVLARYSVSSDANVANPASAATVLTIPHPNNSNHNGGMLAFGNDGYLYWSTGDGGGGGDVPNNAQNTNVLLGKILRLDVNSGSPYSIPSDNPFVGVSGARGEIWDYGFRNPWRFSFDRATQNMYIGDVGEGNREEIDFEPSSSSGGLNFGWRVMEGSLCFNPASGCDTSGKVFPVAEYDNNSATCSVTGGYVYRGSQSQPMTGIYFYGDFCSGEIWGLLQQSPGAWDSDLITDTSFLISSFGEDEAGELYLTDYSSGSVQKVLGPSVSLPTPTFTSIPAGSPTPTFTSIPAGSPTPTASAIPNQTLTPLPQPTATTGSGASVTGQVIASKVVTVRLYDLNDSFVASVNANPDGMFRLDVPAGTYNIVATANGFLRIQGQITLSDGETHAMPVITLLAGDIDDDGSIDQFDAMTIGFSYGTAFPEGADLNNDGIINVLDLELLAKNYRKTGPILWE